MHMHSPTLIAVGVGSSPALPRLILYLSKITYIDFAPARPGATRRPASSISTTTALAWTRPRRPR